MINPEKIINSIDVTNYRNETSIFKTTLEPFIRNKILSSSVFAIIFLISIIYSITNKPIWEGEFQIVLEVEKLDPAGSTLEALSSLGVNNFAESNLKTEVSILKSSSVLKPTFDYVKSTKQEKGDQIKNFYYKDWLKGFLKIELERDTSVLNISYRDNDKDMIIPVLEKISNAYQNYSGIERKKNLENGIYFLNKEIKNIKKISELSMKKLQKFSQENKLGNQDGIPVKSLVTADMNIQNFQVINKKEINNNYDDDDQIDRNSFTFKRLSELEYKLIEKSSKYTEDAQEIKSLKREIKVLKDSITRPSDVLLKYRRYRNQALKDEILLFKMQDQLSRLKLEKARQEDPWELVSIPTLNEKPISPSKKRMIAFGFAAAIIGSILSASLKERLNGLIISIKEFKEILGKKENLTLYTNKINYWDDQINILISSFKDNLSIDDIGLIPLGDINSNQIENIYSIFNQDENSLKVFLIKKVIEAKKCKYLILIGKSGCISKNNLLNLLEEISLLKIPIIGWLYIDKDLIF